MFALTGIEARLNGGFTGEQFDGDDANATARGPSAKQPVDKILRHRIFRTEREDHAPRLFLCRTHKKFPPELLPHLDETWRAERVQLQCFVDGDMVMVELKIRQRNQLS